MPYDRWASGRLCRTALVALLGLPLALSACGLFDDGGAGPYPAAEAYADEADYPNLADVPGQAPRPSPDELREGLKEGLIADRAQARYTEGVLNIESASVPSAPPPGFGEPRVEIEWLSARVVPEGGERVEISWEMERVELVAAGGADDLPGPQLVAVIYFAGDSAELADSDYSTLEEVIAQHKERGGRIHLIGHSAGQGAVEEDPVTLRMISLDLSLKQANAVAAGLADLGAEQDAMLVEAKAIEDVAASELAASELAANTAAEDRRVEIFLEY